jgi:3-dehydroquinate dehydratase/shikimate dehydrogenase
LYETLVDVVVLTANSLDCGSKKMPLNPSLLRAGMAVMDLSDLPGESSYTQEARERGCKVVEPAEVFADYVGSLFKSLTGKDLPPDAIVDGLKD